MKSKHKFVPSQVVPMEECALLSSVPYLSLTIYKDVLLAAAKAIQVFEANVITTFNKDNVAGPAPRLPRSSPRSASVR